MIDKEATMIAKQELIDVLDPLIKAAADTLAIQGRPDEFYLMHMEDLHKLLITLRVWAELHEVKT